MNNIVTPTQGRKEFFKLIKQVNENKKPIIVKPIITTRKTGGLHSGYKPQRKAKML